MHRPIALRAWLRRWALVCLWFGLWPLAASHAASTATGVWSAGSQYLVIAESASPTSVVMVQVDLANPSASKLFVGSRSGSAITATQVAGGAGSLSLVMDSANTSFTGTQVSGTGSVALTGQLLFAYSGSAQDGVWQRTGATDRYLLAMTLMVNQVGTTVLVDLKLGSTLAYDLAAGVIVSVPSTQGAVPTFSGKSILTGNTVTLAFRGGVPATGTYTALNTARPPQTIEQFDVTQLLSLAPP